MKPVGIGGWWSVQVGRGSFFVVVV